MIDMERRKFEESFKDAFEGAEVSPPEGVWTNIELDLEKADGNKIRRRLLFYKMLAAASVAFAMCVAGIGYYATSERSQKFDGASTEKSSDPSEKDNNLKPAVIGEKAENSSGFSDAGLPASSTSKNITTLDHSGQDNNTLIKVNPTAKGNDLFAEGIAITSVPDTKGGTVPGSANDISADAQGLKSAPASTNKVDAAQRGAERVPPSFYSARTPELVFQTSTADPGVLLLARLADEEKQLAASEEKEKKKSTEKLWTSIGFAAGAFNSVNASVTPTPSNSFLMSSSSKVADKQAGASGIAYSYGVNVGTRLSNRWVLQGGVNYMVQSSDYTATNVVGGSNFTSLKAESINTLDNIGQSPQVADPNAANLLAPTFPYTVNNSVKFFSVPVQAGYLVVNKKFGLQLNAGVSTDLFLQNTITPEGGSLDKTTQGRGDDSPYRSFNFSGLMGTEFTYRFGQYYRVALNPGLRYPFNSVYKSEVGVESTPLTFDVGLRFRYIFH